MDDTLTIHTRTLRDAVGSERLAADRLRRAFAAIDADYPGYIAAKEHHEACCKRVDALLYPTAARVA